MALGRQLGTRWRCMRHRGLESPWEDTTVAWGPSSWAVVLQQPLDGRWEGEPLGGGGLHYVNSLQMGSWPLPRAIERAVDPCFVVACLFAPASSSARAHCS